MMAEEKYPKPFLYILPNNPAESQHEESESQLGRIIDITSLLKQREKERRQESYEEISHLADHLVD